MSFLRCLACCFPVAILSLHCGPAEETTSSTSTDEAATGAGAVGTTGAGAAGGASSGSGGMDGGNTAGAGGDAGEPGPPDPNGPLTAVLDGTIPYAFGDISGPLEVECRRMADGRPARFQATASKDGFGEPALPGSVRFEVPHVLTGEVDESSEMIVRFGLKLDEDDSFFLEAGLNRGAYTAVISENDMQSAGRFTASGHITEVWSLSTNLSPADVRFWVDGVFEGGCP